ncbi:HNH endonuclease [Brevibacillus sp. RS1.1]|uniref:HNH endonuclease n=1 Tax=Brevibacillus sp. RS1.1 TaxID=2738982 RepID=UPI00156AD4A3|nr:HNH endonuclease signature motif containing protein [Brevibacillus sp. RS1.1]NRR05928.1 HNH endonuclease [Brevibacillus sp. RS1.1]
MSINEDVIVEVLTRSARHCCICRQFLPLSIQVHHIIEKSDGGTDDFDNLIPVCIQCHGYIHTIPHMTRKFTTKELIKCRDNVYEMVSVGKLPATRSMTRNELETVSSILAETLRTSSNKEDLSDEALKLLSATLCEESSIKINKVSERSSIIIIGNQHFTPEDKFVGQYPKPIIELLSQGLIESKGDELEITTAGSRLVGELVQTTSTYTQKKIKCLNCSLHFIICTWDKDKHDSSSISCPECGQGKGLFLIWTQQKFGFIFQDVPGNAMLYDSPRL